MLPRFAQLRFKPYYVPRRCYTECVDPGKKGLVLGVYESSDPSEVKFTRTALEFDNEVKGKLSDMIRGAGIKRGQVRVVNNLDHPDFDAVAVAGLGEDSVGYNETEHLNECKENIRVAAGNGAMALQNLKFKNIYVEGFSSPEASAEGTTLGLWAYQDLRNKTTRIVESCADLYSHPDRAAWECGKKKAEAQNIARYLEEMPPNILTPSELGRQAIEILCPCGVRVEVRDREWLKDKRWTAFLSVAKNSCETPILIELMYCGGHEEDKPIVIVGKGVTFDSGSTTLRPCRGMCEFKGDMAGAAVTIGVFKAIAQMGLPLNVRALLPVMENMPGMMAMRPGDTVLGHNGKTIRLENLRNEGRVALADALAFSNQYRPCLLINIATLTPGMKTALGASSTGVFTNSDTIWTEMNKAGAETGDRVWRLPLWEYFKPDVTDYPSMDVNNEGHPCEGDPCQGAAFLMEFVPPVHFVHMDITGTGMTSSGKAFPYLRPFHMTGRPTRTLIKFLEQIACPDQRGDAC